MSYWLHPGAEAELGDAAAYYAEHASKAVAEAFLAKFERVRDLLIENPYRGPYGEEGLRVYHFIWSSRWGTPYRHTRFRSSALRPVRFSD